MTECFVGIDISKERLDVGIRPSGEALTFPNDEANIERLLSKLQELKPSSIILEATAGLEASLAVSLAAASLPVVVDNPRQVRDFAKATGQLAKTDRLDAKILAHFAEAVRPPQRPLC